MRATLMVIRTWILSWARLCAGLERSEFRQALERQWETQRLSVLLLENTLRNR